MSDLQEDADSIKLQILKANNLYQIEIFNLI